MKVGGFFEAPQANLSTDIKQRHTFHSAQDLGDRIFPDELLTKAWTVGQHPYDESNNASLGKSGVEPGLISNK